MWEETCIASGCNFERWSYHHCPHFIYGAIFSISNLRQTISSKFNWCTAYSYFQRPPNRYTGIPSTAQHVLQYKTYQDNHHATWTLSNSASLFAQNPQLLPISHSTDQRWSQIAAVETLAETPCMINDHAHKSIVGNRIGRTGCCGQSWIHWFET